MRLVRVNADSKPCFGPQVLEALRLRGLGRIAALEDHHDALQARITRSRDHLIEIGGERFIGEVAVTVDHMRVRPLFFSVVAAACCRSNTANAFSRSVFSLAFVGASTNAKSIELRTMRFRVE